jgi:hypothetical protein
VNWTWPDAKGTIAVILAVSTIVLIALLIQFPTMDGHPAVIAVLNILVGGLISNLTTVVQYYFGSSAESKAKGEVIAQIATAAEK